VTGRQGDKVTGEIPSRHCVSSSPHLPLSPSQLPRALSPHEYVTVAAIAAIIVPTDHDPGATEADVVGYIDRKVSRDAALRQRYAEGVRWIDKASAKLFGRGKRFIDLSRGAEGSRGDAANAAAARYFSLGAGMAQGTENLR